MNYQTYNSSMLATVGDTNITLEQFTNSYSFGPSNLKPKNDPKLFYLEAMINEIVLAQELTKNKQYFIKDDDPRLKLLKQELIIEKIFEIEVDKKLIVTNKEILESIINSRKKVKITFLYSQDFDIISKCLDSLMNGVSFNQLSQIKYLNNYILVKQTPFTNIGQLIQPISDIIFKLPPGDISDIIVTDSGYFIIRIDDIVNRSLSINEIENIRSRHKKIIRNKKSNLLARNFVDSYMSHKDIVVKANSFNNLTRNLFYIYKQFGTLFLDPVLDREQNYFGDWINDSLVIHKEGIIKTKQILEHMSLRPIYLDTNSVDVFSRDLRKKLAVVIRDFFLLKENNDNYNINYDDINKQINLWKRKLIVDDYLNQINTIPGELKTNNSTLNNYLLFNRMNNKQLYEKLNMELDSLKSLIDISINLKLLSGIDIIDNITGHHPELRLFKLGLPYLREAYPTPNKIFAGIK